MTGEVDAVVIGSGPNGLVAANVLADAGWSVLVLEAQPEIGGAVASARDVHADFVHDTFSAFYPMAAVSPALRDLGLERYGLRWSHAPAVLGHPRHDQPWALLERDPEATAARFDAERPGDGDAWLALLDRWRRVGAELVDALLGPIPSVPSGLRTALSLTRSGGLATLLDLLAPASRLWGRRLGGEAPRLLLTGCSAHADVPADRPGSGVYAALLTLVGQTEGFPVPVGGAGALAAALRDRFVAAGGVVRCDAGVTSVEHRSGRAVGVSGPWGRVEVGRAVLADVAAEQLYGRLVPAAGWSARDRLLRRRFRRDPATVKIDYALDGPVPWAVAPAANPGTVHLADSTDELITSQAQLTAGRVPARPFVLLGQMTTSDPTRSPVGTESLWAYAHVPQHIRGDAGAGPSITGRWDRDDAERFADRVQARIETYAPGFGGRVITRRILGPRELEARDANLVGGSINGGTAALSQQLVLRPFPGSGAPRTSIDGLYLASAAAHPGGSVHGACGRNAALAALADDRS